MTQENIAQIVSVLNNIAAKYGYGTCTEPFSNDEWNTLFNAKEILNDYAQLTSKDDGNIEAKFYKYTDECGHVFVGVIAPDTVADELIDFNGNRRSFMSLGFYAISRAGDFLSATSGAKFYYHGKMMSIPEILMPMTDKDWEEFLSKEKERPANE